MSNYRTQLHPWCILRLLPFAPHARRAKAQRITVARFRKRNDADAHMRTLKRLIPQAQFIVIFDHSQPISPTQISPTQPQQSDRNPPPQAHRKSSTRKSLYP